MSIDAAESTCCTLCDVGDAEVEDAHHEGAPAKGVPVSLVYNADPGTFDEGVHYLYHYLLSLSPPEPFSWASHMALRVKFPEAYPSKPEKMVAEPAPFHPNVVQTSGAVVLRAGERWSMSSLPKLYGALLESPRLSEAANPRAAELYAECRDAYCALAAHSVGAPFPAWSPATHRRFPAAVRKALRTLLLAIRVTEQRASLRVQTHAKPAAEAPWPARPLPDDVVHRICALVARDELRALCHRFRMPGGWQGDPCECSL